MSDVELTKLSSKGQIVIPQEVREELGLTEGTTFAITGKGDTIVLKRIIIPSAKKVFEKVHAWGTVFAKQKGLKEEHLQTLIKKNRRI